MTRTNREEYTIFLEMSAGETARFKSPRAGGGGEEPAAPMRALSFLLESTDNKDPPVADYGSRGEVSKYRNFAELSDLFPQQTAPFSPQQTAAFLDCKR